MKYKSSSPEETEKIAAQIAASLTAPRVICLKGDLGAGKTAFTRGFARAFGIEKGVSSPTFTIMHRYEGTEVLNHYDLYRLSDIDELLDIGFEDEIEHGFSLIEWADDFMEIMPPGRLVVSITKSLDNENERMIEVLE